MKKRIVVLGATGMVAQALLKELLAHKKFEVWGSIRPSNSAPPPLYAFPTFPFAVEDLHSGFRNLSQAIPSCDYIINTIATLKSAIQEDNSQSVCRAIQVNALFPHELGAYAQSCSAKVIHISTDGVFSGKSSRAYHENDPADSEDVYGKTKSLGEINLPNALVFRTSFIGPDEYKHKGLLEWFQNLTEGTSIKGYTDQFWQGVTTQQFAEICAQIILHNHFEGLRTENSVHHICPNKAVSKFELVSLFREVLHKNIEIQPEKSPNGSQNRSLSSNSKILREICGANKDIREALLMLNSPPMPT